MATTWLNSERGGQYQQAPSTESPFSAMLLTALCSNTTPANLLATTRTPFNASPQTGVRPGLRRIQSPEPESSRATAWRASPPFQDPRWWQCPSPPRDPADSVSTASPPPMTVLPSRTGNAPPDRNAGAPQIVNVAEHCLSASSLTRILQFMMLSIREGRVPRWCSAVTRGLHGEGNSRLVKWLVCALDWWSWMRVAFWWYLFIRWSLLNGSRLVEAFSGKIGAITHGWPNQTVLSDRLLYYYSWIWTFCA